MTRRHQFSLLLAAFALAGLPACKPGANSSGGKPGATPQKTVFFLSAHVDRPYESGQRQIFTQLIAGQNAATLQSQDAAGNAAVQTTQLKQAIDAKPFAILIDPVNTASISGLVREAVASGIVVIGLGEDATAAPFSSVLYCDQKELGRVAGRIATHALTLKAKDLNQPEVTGRVVEIRGSDKDAACTQRHEGFVEILKTVPGAILVHDAPGAWSRAGGKDRTLEALRLQTSFDIVYAHNDSMALGAAEAAGDQRENILIIGTDGFRGPEGGFDLVNSGAIDATVHQPLLVDFAWTILKKKLESPAFALKPSYALPPHPVTPKDINTIRREGFPALPALE